MGTEHQKDFIRQTFLDAYDSEFSEYLSRAAAAIHTKDDYKKISDMLKACYLRYPNVEAVLDMRRPAALTKEECGILIEAADNLTQITLLEFKEIYIKGCSDCFRYLQKLGILRE